MGVAIVTGAARGIGAATATALAAAGHRLVLVDRCEDDPRVAYALASVEQLLAVADACGGEPIVGDAADETVLARAIEACAHHGGVDIAISAAGVIAGEGPAWEVDDEAWGVLAHTNITAVRRLAAAALPLMLAQPRPRFGRFIAIGSPIADKATPKLAAYAASKAAVESFVRSMAADLAGSDITANTVVPGSTRTALLDHSATIYGLAGASDFIHHHIVDRLIEPADVASMIVWLCSQEASAITGATLPVDGGLSAR